jgi:CSLREA domain-containing protein
VDGAFTSQGYNLIGTADHSSGFTTTGDQAGTNAAQINPQLATLANNGGPTDTFALMTGSPARDKGKSFGLTVDQRGFPRTLDDPALANANGGDGTDIGAFEADAPQAGVSLVVNTTNDHDDGLCGYNDCSLREAINAANSLAGDNTITFKSGLSGVIPLGSALPNVTTNVNIQGPGARILEVNGNNAYRVFSFTSGTSSMSGLTVANGRIPATSGASAFGGGIFNQGTLTLFQCAIKYNSVQGGVGVTGAKSGGQGNGGGVYNSGVLALEDCTLSGNVASGGGGAPGSQIADGASGGAGNGGAIFNNGGATMTLTNCTVSGNTATGGPGGSGGRSAAGGNGGAGHGGIYSNGTLTVTASTVSGNTGTGGAGGSGTPNGTVGAATGGVRNQGSGTFRNFISAGNTGGDVSGTFISQGYNLIGPLGTATGFAATGDQTGVTNPNLGSLQDNGGPTDTMALLLSPTFSPAIDKGKSFGLTTDQRGHLRIADSPSVPAATGGDNTDIGAFEFHPLSGSDTDGDGMPNDFEFFYGFNPNFNGDAALDADGDGLTNLQEFQAGTDPRDPTSNLRVIVVAKNGNDFNVTFKLAVLGKSYRLERKDAMTDTFWSSINGVPDFTPAFSGSGQITDPGGASVSKHFYHVRVLP